jgi:hypothetical protein
MISPGSKPARAALALALLACAAAGGFFAGRGRPNAAPVLQPGERLADTSAVLVAVRGLARIESVAFHMERVIDLKNTQPRMFGLVEATDAILLVAAGDVVAGIDLTKMTDGDVSVEPRERRVRLRLPAPEILSASLDNARTYVHTRRTDLLAERSDQIETRARQLAESSIREAALQAGVLERARQGTEHTLTVLVRSLGFDHVEIAWPQGVATGRQ